MSVIYQETIENSRIQVSSSGTGRPAESDENLLKSRTNTSYANLNLSVLVVHAPIPNIYAYVIHNKIQKKKKNDFSKIDIMYLDYALLIY